MRDLYKDDDKAARETRSRTTARSCFTAQCGCACVSAPGRPESSFPSGDAGTGTRVGHMARRKRLVKAL